MSVQVHRNGPLVILPQFFKKEGWGVSRDSRIYGGCLIMQVIYAVGAHTGLQESKLFEPFLQLGYVPTHGISLGEIAEVLQKALPAGYTITAKRHSTVDQAIAALQEGKTTIAIYNSNSMLSPEAARDDTYTVSNHLIENAEPVLTKKGKPVSPYMHTLMIVGYDAKEGTIILRESRPEYGLYYSCGLAKYSVNAIRRANQPFAYIEIGVERG